MARTGLAGVPTAEGSSLGRAVAGTVRGPWLAGWVVLTAAGSTAAALAAGGPRLAVGVLAGVAAGLLAAEALLRRASARLGGVTGDVMGAMGELATTAALLVMSLALG
jgi:adenosylcobinamide-GDP ribazoletransferase